MTIEVGHKLPRGEFRTMSTEGVKVVQSEVFFAGRRIVLFAVPAVFTPGCTNNHLPSYIENAEAILAKGFDEIACMSVSDAWVMDAWAREAGAGGKITMLADGSASYAMALGLELDLSHVGMGMRCKRFSMVVDDGYVQSLNVDERMIEATSAPQTCGLKGMTSTKRE